jgi:hypothetical protein
MDGGDEKLYAEVEATVQLNTCMLITVFVFCFLPTLPITWHKNNNTFNYKFY